MLAFLFPINSSSITHTAVAFYSSCSWFLYFKALLAFALEAMASSSSSHHQNREFNAFDGIEPPSKRWKASVSSSLFDVFINHRGPDVKQTLATQLYISLEQLGIRAFLDSQEKELGNSFPNTIKTAIRSAKVHIAIFSKRYAESPWCLAELVQMLESKAKIIPVFYEVEPWELRHIETGQYAAAFTKYEEKGRFLEKLSEWKEALQSLSFIAGEEFHSSSDLENIVAAVQKEVQRKRCLHVAKYPVGLNNLVKDFERRCLDELVQDFENQCRLQEREHKPNIVGIFGMGGIGKTTLAKELFNRKCSNYSSVSFLFDVREASVKSELPSLQSKLLNDLFNEKNLNFRSIEEGASCLKDRLERSRFSNFFIVLDDIDHTEQLDALLIMDILAKSRNSLVIVTTRDVGVVITAGITVGYPLRGMDKSHGSELFCWHAFGEPRPRTGYEALVYEFVDVCGGLPLSLQVLGRHVHGRDHSYWKLELIKAKTTLPRDVKQRLRISFESLDEEEKQIFMDIACIFVNKKKSIAKRVWEASGWNARHALETLKDKCLVEEIEEWSWSRYTEREIELRMHDHLRDLGRELAHDFSPPHRLWRPQDLQSLDSMCFKTILTKTNIRCFNSMFDESMGSTVTFFLCQSDSWIETSASLPWLQIQGNSGELSSIPSWIPLKKLHYLIIKGGQLKTLWQNGMQVPTQLKELQISQTSLKEFPDFSGTSNNLKNVFLDAQGLPITGMHSTVRAPMSGLEKLEISYEECVSKILIIGMHYPSLQCIKLQKMKMLEEVDLRMVKTLNSLEIMDCKHLKSLSGISDLAELIELKISGCEKIEIESLCFRGVHLRCIEVHGMKKLEEVDLRMVKTLNSLEIKDCKNLTSLSGISDLAELVELKICDCEKLKIESLCFKGVHLQCIKAYEMKKLEQVDLRMVKTLNSLEVTDCKTYKRFSGISDLAELVELKISDCEKTESFCLRIESLCFRGVHLQCIKFHKLRNLEEVDLRMVKTLNSLEITDCKNLKSLSGISDLSELVELKIFDCEKLEIESLCFRGTHHPSLQFIKLQGMRQLVEVDLKMVKTLTCLEITNCKNLRTSVSGTTDLPNLVELKICDCGMLEFESSCLRDMKCLERITFLRNGIVKCFELNGCENLKTAQVCCEKVVELRIQGCPKLEEIPAFIGPSCPERIIIDGCRIQVLRLYRCQNLRSVSCNFQFTEVHIHDCPQLEEFSSLTRQCSFRQIVISSCKKVENIAGIEELFVSDYMKLTYCSNALIRNCIHTLKRVPGGVDMIGRAADGAESNLNKNLFYEANIGVDGVIEICTNENYPNWSELSAIIVCFVVVVDSLTLVENINKSLANFYGLKVCEGEWIITMVTCDDWRYSYYTRVIIGEFLLRKGVMKKGFRVEVVKGEEWKSVELLHKIVDRLCY